MNASSPRGLRRWFFRAPVGLYRRGLGGLMGSRYVLLTHTGRVSGEPRQAVLEIIERDASTGALLVASGFGPGAQWYRNVSVDPKVTIQVGRDARGADALVLAPQESATVLAELATRRPALARRIERSARPQPGAPTPVLPGSGASVPFVRIVPR